MQPDDVQAEGPREDTQDTAVWSRRTSWATSCEKPADRSLVEAPKSRGYLTTGELRKWTVRTVYVGVVTPSSCARHPSRATWRSDSWKSRGWEVKRNLAGVEVEGVRCRWWGIFGDRREWALESFETRSRSSGTTSAAVVRNSRCLFYHASAHGLERFVSTTAGLFCRNERGFEMTGSEDCFQLREIIPRSAAPAVT